MRVVFLLPFLLGSVPAWAELILVSISSGSHATVIDASSLRPVADVTVGAGPHEITVSASGEMAWVANTGASGKPGDSVTVIDLRRRAAVQTLKLENCRPHDLRVVAEGGPLWVTCAEARAVLEIDPWTGEPLRRWPLEQEGAWMLDVSNDSSRVYTANLEGGGVTIVDRIRGHVSTVKTHTGEMGFDLTPDGRMLWLANFHTHQISIADAVSGKISAAFAAGAEAPARVRFTPDGKRAVVTYLSVPKIAVFDVASGSPTAWIDIEAPAKVVALSPDGNRAVASIPTKKRVVIIDLIAARVVQMVDVAGTPDGVAWAADPPARQPAPVAFTIADRELIPEGIAYDPVTKSFFVSSTHRRKVVRIDERGHADDFTSEAQDGLWGVVGMRVDPKRRQLWVASMHVGAGMPMIKLDPAAEGSSALHVYDIPSGRFLRKYETPKGERHALNDLTITSDGDVYVTDSRGGAVYHVRRDSTELERFLSDPKLQSPNGIDYDARRNRLYLTAGESIYAIDLPSRELRPVSFPPHLFYPGSDGLYFHDGSLISVNPSNRIVRYVLDGDGLNVLSAKILEIGHERFEQPSTGVIVGNAVYVIANTHLQTFAAAMRGDQSLRAKLRPPAVLLVPLK